MNKMANQDRRELKKKLAKSLNDKIKPLPAPIQKILLDDLITAFESRLRILSSRSLTEVTVMEKEVIILQ
jgi:hypothetical protein